MFQTLLSPLKARFDQLSPRSSAGTFLPALDAPSAEDVQSPEDFARDVLVQLMRNSVENLKMADTQVVQGEILSEILRIMQQDAFTKGVFREMDGFLVLMSVLSTIQVKPETNTPTIEVTVAGADKSTSCSRLVFSVLIEALVDEPENEDFFRSRVGYESLSFALRSLLSDPLTVDETLGLLLALSMSNFSLEEYFVDLRRIEDLGGEADEVVTSAQSTLKTIVRPEPLGILWDAAIHLPLAHTSPSLRYGLYKLFEALFHVNHRNQGVLASLNLVRTLFPRFCEARNDANVSERERHALQKLLRRLLEMGSTTEEARKILQHAAVKAEGGEERLDPDMLDLVRFGMKSRWSDHFSMESPAAFDSPWTRALRASRSLLGPSCTLFSATLGTRRLLRLSIRQDGKLQLHSSSQAGKDPPFVSSGGVRKNRWAHLSLVHYPHRGTNPSLRESTAQRMQYSVGSVEQGEGKMSWSLASAYLFSVPVGEDVPRFIHHLGPRYSGNFQDPGLVRFLTYEASTSLNMFLTSVSSKQYANPLSPSAVSPTDTPDQPMSIAAALGAMASNPGSGASPQSVIVDKSQTYVPASKQTIIQSGMMKVVKFGVGVTEAHIVFSFSAADCHTGGVGVSIPIRGQIKVKAQASAQRLSKSPSVDNALRLEGAYVGDGVESQGDVFVVKAACLDSALWKIGGAAVALKLVQLAKTPHELSRSLGILVDGLRNSWQNSEDMERLRGYEILAEMLRSKASLINLTAFETVFEFLGVNFSSPEHSTVVNVVGYRVIALDFDLWSRSKKEIQLVYLEHFVTLLKTSRYKTFNAKQRLSKMNLVRKLLFALQADWYHGEMLHTFMEVLQVASEMIFSKEETIKPLVSYLAANLHEVLVSLLSHQQLYAKFITCPTHNPNMPTSSGRPAHHPPVAFHILRLVNSFRKFELISGWSVMKTVLPTAWSLEVNGAAFDILLGRFNTEADIDSYTVVACQGIMPSILTALGHGLSVVSKRAHLSDSEADAAHITWDTENTLEAMLETMMKLPYIFRSQQATQMFIDGYKQTVEKLKTSPSINQLTGRILEKLSHLGLALALDNARFASARFSMQVGERTVIKTMTRMAEWRKTIQVSERKRLRKTILDLREHRRQIARLSEWSNLLTSERGLWPDNIQRLWRLDETEGPHRIRMKLEPQDDKPAPSRVDTLGELVRDVHPPESDTLSVHQAEVPPWAESYEISSTDMEDKQLVEDIVDDKLRRIRHELEPGDFIDAVATVARVAGVDSSPGLLIIGKSHIYMLDGVVENDDGEVIDAHDAPKRLLFIPGSIVELDGPQRAQRWSHAQIATCSDKRFLFRDVALEVYFKDSRSLLVVFLDKKKRSDIEHRLTAIITKNNTDPSLSTAPLRTPLFGRMGSRVLSNFRADEFNFTYLSILNQISGRTPSDATQYPIFPWVLADYSSETLDLSAPEVFRDLTKPMGALTAIRREAAETRYTNLKSVDEEPFHYGTHFSSSMIVCHFLIRLAPFTHMFKTLQGGDWDLPDPTWLVLMPQAAEDPRGDVRELIPEFFTCPEFLENYQHLDFGVLQQTGERIDDVKLPVWARDDPLLFIVMNRRALESPYVSEHLPQWIDLIWGSKQKDVPSLNVFHPLSYEGFDWYDPFYRYCLLLIECAPLDLDKIKDDLEREATVGIIHNFGQTPRKLFNNPHPERLNHGLSTLPIGTLHGIEEDPHLLTQNERCFKDLGPDLPIREFVPDSYGDKLIPCQENVLTIPLHPYEQIAWGGSNSELRVLADHKVVQVIESTSTTCAAFADAHNLVTGASDYTVRLWKVLRTQNASDLRLALSHIMRVHTNEVVCVTASRTWSLVGYIATCSRLKLCLHTVNARLIATLDLTTTPSFSPLVPSITSIAFHERDYSNLGVLATGGPDGTITLRTWTADGTPVGEKAQWEFLVIRTMKAKPARNGRPVGVTALKFSGETLYHGEESGKSFIWTLPD
ncbi:hypothetical protein DFP72DRAFT_988225 [Ephemerocybe angulata]|uniref:Beach-domain-containing protein n=1 Tax=Ephemerocybe angulata TaxID=980116 RepID=A0A8H6MCY6_9AGAR|nr:hypothetical protein DFP72DRAFT_988225 [Tulosesus angulatus]